MFVQDAMTIHPAACRPGENLAEAAAMMWAHDCGSLPVVDDGGKPVGFVTDRDMLIALGTRNARAGDVRVADVMTSPVVTCTPEDPIELALSRMNGRKIRRLVVTGADGTVAGILTMNDVVLHAGRKRGKDAAAVPYEEVMSVLKGICDHSRANGGAQAVAA